MASKLKYLDSSCDEYFFFSTYHGKPLIWGDLISFLKLIFHVRYNLASIIQQFSWRYDKYSSWNWVNQWSGKMLYSELIFCILIDIFYLALPWCSRCKFMLWAIYLIQLSAPSSVSTSADSESLSKNSHRLHHGY